ncbi:MAG: UDP-glucose 4-epimerase GalE [Bdellovibrio sp.]
MRSKVLVTGGAGYIGSHACVELLRNGFEPVVLDNLSRGFRHLVRTPDFYDFSLDHKKRVLEICREHRIDQVLHFAAYAYVDESVREPLLYFENNDVQALVFLEALREAGVRNFVFSSTCATYGIPKQIPISETEEQNPINPYGRSKLLMEAFLREIHKSFKINISCLRYFNVAGADPLGEVGECHEPETHLIPRSIQKALRGEALQIFGKDYPTKDGTCIRDYIHVTDLIRGHLLTLDYQLKNPGFHVFNLGTGIGWTNLEVAREILKQTQSPSQIEFFPRRPGDPPQLIADPSRAQNILGFKTLHSSLQTMVATALQWERRLRSLDSTDSKEKFRNEGTK